MCWLLKQELTHAWDPASKDFFQRFQADGLVMSTVASCPGGKADWLLPKGINEWVVKYTFTCQFGDFKEEADRKQVSLGVGS